MDRNKIMDAIDATNTLLNKLYDICNTTERTTEIIDLIKKHSKNSGNYVPDYEFSNLALSIVDYYIKLISESEQDLK